MGPPGMRRLARAHGAFNIISGVWPLVHMASFEAVTGPKVDRWLVRTVAGLLVTNGLTQLASAASDDARAARLLGLGTASTLAVIDVAYSSQGRIPKVYLVDAAAEAAWTGAWLWTLRRAVSTKS